MVFCVFQRLSYQYISHPTFSSDNVTWTLLQREVKLVDLCNCLDQENIVVVAACAF